jgi:3-methyladenine DNA glycosylase/8-oxoguanine DNA glycosylase
MRTDVRRTPRDLPFDWDDAIAHLARSDPRLGVLIEEVNQRAHATGTSCRLQLAHTQSLFHALCESIVYQQLSGKAAATIFGRVRAVAGPQRRLTPAGLAATAPTSLRAAGLSNAKTRAVLDLARRADAGELPTLPEARRLSDDELVERLTAVRGIGPWTVHMFLIFRLGRPDVLPTADLGVRKGFQVTYRKRKLPEPEALVRHAEQWRPYRTVGSWFMWRALDSQDGA